MEPVPETNSHFRRTKSDLDLEDGSDSPGSRRDVGDLDEAGDRLQSLTMARNAGDGDSGSDEPATTEIELEPQDVLRDGPPEADSVFSSTSGTEPETYTNDDTIDGSELARANSIIGGQSVGEHEQRLFGFELPFSNPWPTVPPIPSLGDQILKVRQKLFSDNKQELETISIHDIELHSDDEDREFGRPGRFVNPRTHAIRTSFRTSTQLSKNNPLPHIGGPVIVMGGYRGSVLKDAKTGDRLWVPFKAGLKMGKANLQLGLDDDSEKNAHHRVVPGKVLSHVGPIDISRRLIRSLRSQRGAVVYQFGYDWRLSGQTNSEKLYDLVKEANKKSDGKGVLIIAHSMGGIIAHHTLQKFVRENQQGQKFIRGIVYAGTPSECPSILGPLRRGDSVLLAKNVLTPKANFAMRSSFLFLPRTGRCFVDKHDVSKEYRIDFMDPQSWINFGLSPCVSNNPDVRRLQTAGDPDIEEFDFAEAVEYLTRQLERANAFNAELERIDGAKYPPMVMLYGTTLPTARGAKVDGKHGIRTTDLGDLWLGGGDGVVYRKHLLPLSLGKYEEDVSFVPTKYGHVALLSDLDAVGLSLEAIIRREGSKVRPPTVLKRSATTAKAVEAASAAGAMLSRSTTNIMSGAKEISSRSRNFLRIPSHMRGRSLSSLGKRSSWSLNGGGTPQSTATPVGTPPSGFLSEATSEVISDPEK